MSETDARIAYNDEGNSASKRPDLVSEDPSEVSARQLDDRPASHNVCRPHDTKHLPVYHGLQHQFPSGLSVDSLDIVGHS